MQVKAWKESMSPVSTRDLSLWEHKITGALGKLPYLQSLNSKRGETYAEPTITFRVTLKDMESNSESVMKDYMTVLSGYVVGDLRGICYFGNQGDGFVVDLAIVDRENCFVTTRLQTSYNR